MQIGRSCNGRCQNAVRRGQDREIRHAIPEFQSIPLSDYSREQRRPKDWYYPVIPAVWVHREPTVLLLLLQLLAVVLNMKIVSISRRYTRWTEVSDGQITLAVVDTSHYLLLVQSSPFSLLIVQSSRFHDHHDTVLAK